MITSDKIQATIKNVVENKDVVLFMKGTKEAPQCGFSNAVVNTLSFMNVDFKDVNVLDNDDLREGIKIFTDWPTIPQLYVKGEFVGGCHIIQDMYKSGELAQVLKSKNISHS